MAELYSERCTACRRDSPHVTDAEIAELRPSIDDWDMIDESDIPKLDRQFKFSNFVNALQFTNALGELAESEGHHPRLTTEWGRVNGYLVDAQNTQPASQRLRNGRQKPTHLYAEHAPAEG